ncbi:MAG: DUF4405 domain-containing protein [Ignavibacteriaceae bacterium]
METPAKFNTRAFTAIGMFISGIGLPLSGYMNHVLSLQPLIDQQHHIWMSVHNILAVFFVIFSTWHIILNWKALKNHIKKSSRVMISREFVYAAALVIFFLALSVLHAVAAGSRM